MRQFAVVLRILLIVAILVANFGGVVQAAPARQTDPPPPVAQAGPPSIIGEPGGLITLNGGASTGSNITFQWRQISGLTVTLNGANTAVATFIFPFVPGVALPVLTFELTVTDSLGRTATDTILVTEQQLPAAPALSVIDVPEPPNLATYVRNKPVAIQLGKALFWDMQLGSDGVTACASCHYAAGTDNRVTNQINPGPNGVFDTVGPNGTLSPASFPFHLVDPAVTSQVLRSWDDIVGTQGVQRADFGGINPGQPVDGDLPVADPVFHVNGVNTRQVTARSAPSVINAIYNLRNFWDGRANFVFNGVTPFGNRDAGARIWAVQPDQSLAQERIQIEYASLASQAVGPANSAIEMAWRGRSFPLLARKMYGLSPLALQQVDATDSVLGPLASPNGTGLNISYLTLVQAAFEPRFWDSTNIVVFDALGTPSVAPNPNRPLTNDEFSLVEMNFSLFFGLAIQLYEATLISDQTPYDRFQQGELTALTAQQQRGMEIFNNVTGCSLCHFGPEFTSATVSALLGPPLPGFPEEPAVAVERMAMADGQLAVYDLGFYNIGVRPTAEDLGQGATDPFGAPLSFTRLIQQGVPIGPPVPAPPLITPGERAAIDGAFKTPSLRNVELTAPYMHNGGMSSLAQVVDFYARGSDFRQQNLANLAPAIVPLPITEQDEQDLVAFMRALTDERVRMQSAPFDHPQLLLPNGDGTIEFPAVGATGGLRIEPFVEINPGLTVSQVVEKPVLRLGDSSRMTVTVQNSGDVVLRQVVAEASHCTLGAPAGNRWSADALDPGESWTYTCQIAPVDDGTSLVTISGRHKLGQTVSANATQPLAVQKPSLAVGITAAPAAAQPGQTITYNYVVTNTGNVPLTGVTVGDDRLGAVALNATSLAPGATATGALPYVAQVADILATLANTASASGQPPLGAAVTGQASIVVDVTGAALQVTVQPDRASANVGESVTYGYIVRNLGDVQLSGVTLADNRIGAIALSTTALASGATATGSASTLITPADWPGPLVTAATATGTPVAGGAVTHTGGASVSLSGAAALAVSVSKPASASVATTVQYTYQITNTGPVPFGSLTARDTLLGPIVLASGLAPGQSTTAVAPLSVVETQLPGPLANTVTVTGTTVAGLPVTATAGGSLALTSDARLVVTQTVTPATASPGTVLTYTVQVRNTGNVSLRGVSAASDRLGAITLASGNLAPGQATTGTATRTIVEGDLPGPFTSIATATGTPRYGNGPAVTATDSDSVTLTSSPALQITATANPTTIAVGQAVGYSYRVRNTGDVTLSNLVVSDNRTGVIVSPVTTLAPGASVDLASSYVVQESNLPGPLVNGVSASARTALNQPVSAAGSTSVVLTTGPAIQIVVTASPSPANIGQVVTFNYLVRNVGNVTLDGILASDTRLGNVPLGATSLAPGAATTGTRTRTVTESDLPGPLTHVANASGTPSFGAVATASTSVEVAVAGQPAIQLAVQADSSNANVGDTVSFTYIAQNVGDVTLTGVSITDARLGEIQLDRMVLQPGQNASGSASYVVRESDLDGPLAVTATAAGNPPGGLAVVSVQRSTQVAISGQPALTVQWTPSAGTGAIGKATIYTYTVTNAGNLSLEAIALTDSRLGAFALDSTTLAPGASAHGVASLTPGQGDLPGPIVTQATASGTPVYGSGGAVSAQTSTALSLATNPALLVHVQAPPSVAVGATVDYTYRITNTGDVMLIGLQAIDSRLGPIALATTVLPPGAGTWGAASLQAAETLLPGPLSHTVAVTGTPPVGAKIVSAGAAEVQIASQPALVVTQQASKNSANVGESLTFAVQVRNAGDVTLANVAVTSDRFGPLTLDRTELAPGQSASAQVVHMAGEGDLPLLTSAISAAAVTKYGGAPVLAADSDSVSVTGSPAFAVTLAAPATARIGDTVAIDYVVKNTGNVSLVGVSLNDDLFGPVALSNSTIAPGASVVAQRQIVVAESHLPGPLASRAAFAATAPLGQRLTATRAADIALESQGALALAVAATVDEPAAGDAVRLRYEVHNTGDVTINGISVVDNELGPITLTATTLRPGERATGNAVRMIQPADVIGAFVHTVTAAGVDSIGRPVQASRSNTVAISGGTIIVKVVGEGDGPQETSVTFNGATFTASLGHPFTFEALHTGRYTIRQESADAWAPSTALCDGGSWESASPSEVEVALTRGQVITCTFTLDLRDDGPGGAGAATLYLPVVQR
ncbi:MAG: hypothetical protein M9936_04595 [Caldilinea sp.]|nr:hypothetical protein [Caldilinea sp.]